MVARRILDAWCRDFFLTHPQPTSQKSTWEWLGIPYRQLSNLIPTATRNQKAPSPSLSPCTFPANLWQPSDSPANPLSSFMAKTIKRLEDGSDKSTRSQGNTDNRNSPFRWCSWQPELYLSGKPFNWLTGLYPKKILEAAHVAREEKKSSSNFEQCKTQFFFFFWLPCCGNSYKPSKLTALWRRQSTMHFSRPKCQFP